MTAVVHLMSEDHNLSNSRERKRIGDRKPVIVIPCPVEAYITSPPHLVPDFLYETNEDFESLIPGQEGQSTDLMSALDAVERRQDVPTRQRISGFDYFVKEYNTKSTHTRKLVRQSAAYIADVKKYLETSVVKTKLESMEKKRLNNGARHPLGKNSNIEEINKSDSHVKCLPSSGDKSFNLDDTVHAANSRAEMSKKGNIQADESVIQPTQVYKHSFISRRVSADGKNLGPEAIFGRFNLSIMMTRSIGDEFGPRSCVAIPETSATLVPSGMFARFILASDGFWDVASLETVRKCALKRKFRDPLVLAKHLADKGKRYRINRSFRSDDITVLIVDINPNEMITVTSDTGSLIRNVQLGEDGNYHEAEDLAGCSSGCTLT